MSVQPWENVFDEELCISLQESENMIGHADMLHTLLKHLQM